jgi:uncharacterized protein YjiS (DUF1127 family)
VARLGAAREICRLRDLEDAMTTEQRFSQRAAPVPGAIHAATAFVAQFALRLAKAFRHRRDLEALASFDDRLLADIGLTRGDLRFALSEPFWRDPALVLTNRAGERRAKQSRAMSMPSIVPAQRQRVPIPRPASRAA